MLLVEHGVEPEQLPLALIESRAAPGDPSLAVFEFELRVCNNGRTGVESLLFGFEPAPFEIYLRSPGLVRLGCLSEVVLLSRKRASFLIEVALIGLELEDLLGAFAQVALGIGQLDTALSEPCFETCLLYTSPSPRDRQKSRMPSSA